MTNQFKNPVFWCLISVLVGIGLGVLGLIRNDAIGNYKGAGFLEWSGGILLLAGLIGWQVLGGSSKRKN